MSDGLIMSAASKIVNSLIFDFTNSAIQPFNPGKQQIAAKCSPYKTGFMKMEKYS